MGAEQQEQALPREDSSSTPATGTDSSVKEISEQGWNMYRSILEKFPKVPVDFAMLSIVYMLIMVPCIVLFLVCALFKLEYTSDIIMVFEIVTGLFFFLFVVYFIFFRLKK